MRKRRKASNGEHVHENTEVLDEDRTWLDSGNARGRDRPYSSAVKGEAVMGTGDA